MNSATLTQLLYSFCALSVLLLIGTFLRGVVPAFRKLFLPASVIGGVIGRLVGPIVWQGGGIPFPETWLTTWSTLPGILIVPVVASVPLGMAIGTKEGKATKATTNVIKVFGLITLVGAAQTMLGIGVKKLFDVIQPALNLYPTFGFELFAGFNGGPGTAGVIGSMYRDYNLDYWKIAQGLTSTTATFGIVGGMIIGIISINIAARRGDTAILTKPGDLPPDMARGYERDPAKQKSAGKDTTLNSSIESLTFHLSIILGGCGLAYIVMNLVKAYKVPGFSQVPIWAYAIIVMFGVNFVIQKIGLGSMIDDKTKSKIAGTCSDYAIVASIASLPIQAVLKYIAPLVVLLIGGYVVTYFLIMALSKAFFPEYWFEHAMTIWGTCCGVFLTGLMLLKICDPDFKSSVLNNYSVGFSFSSVLGYVIMPASVLMMLHYSFGANMLFQFGILVASLVVIFFSDRIYKVSVKKGAENA
ncbi:sodium/glutamate symporter family protein [Faecalispora anaeroviscerum]|uniref:hypothetical protein n=1 Tax=Faecalispora anaeroviscerum TaxID=2991836 RepID=UPI0024BAED38|nr:hypothetical protein [Faecalispora anaeroviscerum]